KNDRNSVSSADYNNPATGEAIQVDVKSLRQLTSSANAAKENRKKDTLKSLDEAMTRAVAEGIVTQKKESADEIQGNDSR
ncbi:hypothetical protein FQN50_008930, partial [Emmonsiellopsis sp. PD_5]